MPKSAQTLDAEVSQARSLRAQIADLTALNAKLRSERDLARTECARKEHWINRYALQLKQLRRKQSAAATPAALDALREGARRYCEANHVTFCTKQQALSALDS